MKTIVVRFKDGRSSTLSVGAPLGRLGDALKGRGLSSSALVVSARPVARHYGAGLLQSLARAGFNARLALVPDGESAKNIKNMLRLYGEALKARLDRKSVIIALGGGVVGDMAGFLAATYMRGVAVAQCPTTLLAMVDAAIGGKTGVDLPQGKNLVGAFHQPLLVWMDLTTLKTLPDREWRTGLAEVIKYGVIKNPGILDFLNNPRVDLAGLRSRPARMMEEIVVRCARIKAKVVEEDERETKGLREILNFGHTFGHAIESASGYKTYTHGEAVAIGMCAATALSCRVAGERLKKAGVFALLINRWGLPTRVKNPLPRKKIMQALLRDKKTLAGRLRFVVPSGPGRAVVATDVSSPDLDAALGYVGL